MTKSALAEPKLESTTHLPTTPRQPPRPREPVHRRARDWPVRRTVYRPVARPFARVAVLAIADVSVLAAITWLASGLFEQLHAVPALSGISLATLLGALVLTGSYGPGERRVSHWRLLIGTVAGLLVVQAGTVAAMDPLALGAATAWAMVAFLALLGSRLLVDRAVDAFRARTAPSPGDSLATDRAHPWIVAVPDRPAETVLDERQLATKRVMDVVLSLTAMVALSPLLLVVAGAVKLTSPGPVLFRQKRVGLGGETFDIFKFRSMAVDAEARKAELQAQSVYGDARLFKVADDPRVTPIGRFLRKASLDELPQLINVLRGEMSLVGPRPPILEEVALYEAHHYCRFDVKPGITGPWQVGGRNRITDFETVIHLEREYIRNWSTTADLKILLKTIPAVLRMDGAH